MGSFDAPTEAGGGGTRASKSIANRIDDARHDHAHARQTYVCS